MFSLLVFAMIVVWLAGMTLLRFRVARLETTEARFHRVLTSEWLLPWRLHLPGHLRACYVLSVLWLALIVATIAIGPK